MADVSDWQADRLAGKRARAKKIQGVSAPSRT
jgi:hypothetical protein